jgi:D-3-phosphoglycerate dehydrogenase
MPEAEVVDAGQARIAEALFTADIFCGHAKVPVDWDGVVGRGRLQWIQSSAAGMDHCLVPSVVASNIAITSASGVLADQVAEHTIALVTAWCRNLPAFFRAQQRRDFARLPTRDLHGSTVGIVGFGGVGRRLARLMAPFRTRIVATDMFPIDKPDYVESLWPPERLDNLLSQSDVVVLALPLNQSTRGILDAKALARMKPAALLANMARGPLVVTGDLVAALEAHALAGAVMDVTDPEPLPPDNPLWAMPNVVITPHVGGQSITRQDDVTRLFCENLRRWKSAEPLINYLSDKKLGFPIRGRREPLWVDVVETLVASDPETVAGNQGLMA